MSILDKFKRWLGVGPLDVQLRVPARAQKATGQVVGNAVLRAMTDQQVSNVVVTLKETWSFGRGDEFRARQFELGKVTLAESLEMKAGEARLLDFVLPFEVLKSSTDALIDRGGALRLVGKAAAFARCERSTYEIAVVADVKGATLPSLASRPIDLV